MLETGVPINLIIVGTGDESYQLKLINIVNSLQIHRHVKFLGYLTNPIEILMQSDLLLMCSQNEAFGLVTLEAMENGIPVIGTNRGGTIELVINNLTGLTYEPGNYFELADKIKYLYDNPDQRKKFVRNAHKHINELISPEKYIESTINVLHRAIS